ncbi:MULTISPECIES: hypothetical protein [unclassified Rhodococcus (in: high G+C Gram-positive bacteria)]|uniref:hypothetical protein n=1 Tax=unclassified Rhodococcus (in: high G+C Gram-positive bacteria) TaxID=192944 RepID=UPI00163AC378|nr:MULTISPECIES: hypothetical protein [unclassified Rhodococcus (in: high G+C Gram-positive bacteria)]MBC2640732.1 hypothetical protein [Rhodococcus sp. 3A]MBC2894523.1 hypothetical protein [Rhodococcus sp. 4CII]
MTAAVLGWVGTIGTLMAYLLANRGRLSIKSRRYAMVNAVGGVLSGTASALYGAWPSAAANFAWALVGTHALLIGVSRGPSPFAAVRSLARSHGSRRAGKNNRSRPPRYAGIVSNHASAMPAAPRCTSGIRPPATHESGDSPRAGRHSDSHTRVPSPGCRSTGLLAACGVDRDHDGVGTNDVANAHPVERHEEAAAPALPQKFAISCVMSTVADNDAAQVVTA